MGPLLLFSNELVNINQHPSLSTMWISDLCNAGISAEKIYSQYLSNEDTFYQYGYLPKGSIDSVDVACCYKSQGYGWFERE